MILVIILVKIPRCFLKIPCIFREIWRKKYRKQDLTFIESEKRGNFFSRVKKTFFGKIRLKRVSIRSVKQNFII
jgi:hypothetical protein